MKDVSKGLRQAVYDEINGNLTWDGLNVPIYDEKEESNATLYVLLSTQTETADDHFSGFITKATILIDIVHRTFDSVSKDAVDTVAGQIGENLLPTPNFTWLTPPAGFIYANVKRESARSLDFQISHKDSVIRKLLTYSLDITQQ